LLGLQATFRNLKSWQATISRTDSRLCMLLLGLVGLWPRLLLLLFGARLLVFLLRLLLLGLPLLVVYCWDGQPCRPDWRLGLLLLLLGLLLFGLLLLGLLLLPSSWCTLVSWLALGCGSSMLGLQLCRDRSMSCHSSASLLLHLLYLLLWELLLLLLLVLGLVSTVNVHRRGQLGAAAWGCR
jgi:hypothetical protein